MTYRSGWMIAGLLGAVLAAPAAIAAPLLSADVTIASSPAIFPAAGPTSNSPPVPTVTVSGSCGGLSCSYSFTLSTTGFDFLAECEVDFGSTCNMPSFTVTLTNMVFQPGATLLDATLKETDNTYDQNSTPIGTVSHGTNSVTLSVASFVVSCFGNLQETVTFITTETGVPEPSTLSLLGLGALGLAWWRRERRRPVA